MKNILIIGASGHAKVIIDIIEKQGIYNIVGLIDSYKKEGDLLYDYCILGTENDIPKLVEKHSVFGGIIAIGDNFSRMNIYRKIDTFNLDFVFINAIHPNAIVGKNVLIGSGTCIMAGVVINSDVQIGKQCIINTKSSVGHDCTIKDFSSIAPGATLGGNVKVGRCSSISIGTTIVESTKIGKYSIMGAHSLVNKHFGDYIIAYGTPARHIRNRKKDSVYMGINKLKDMFLDFKTIENSDDAEEYNQIIGTIKSNSVFYSLYYYNSFNNTKKISYFVLKKHNKPEILLPIYLNEINFDEDISSFKETYYDAISPYGYSGPLFNDNSKSLLSIFWEEVDKWYRKNNVVTEFIRFNLNENHENYSGHIIQSLKNIKGELTDFESIWTNFKQKTRNNYRKALKNNLKIEFFYDNIEEHHLDNFYDIYLSTMRRTGAAKNYFYPKAYFHELVKNNLKKILLVFVKLEDTAISTELIIIENDTLFSYLGGTLSDYFDYRPNDFLKVEVIKWGLHMNFKYYVLGGGRTDNDNLYKYKKTFFPKDDDIIFCTGRKIINKDIYNTLLKNISVDFREINAAVDNSNNYFPLYRKETNITKNKAFEIITSKEEWGTFLKSVKSYDFYHTYDYHVLSKEQNDEAILLKYKDKNCLIGIPLLLRRIENTDYFDATSVYGYSGPLTKGITENFNNCDFKETFFKFLTDQKIVSIFSRLNPFITNQETILNGLGDIVELGNIVNIDLNKNIDDQRTIFSKTTKRYINKCRKIFDVKKSESEEDLLTFMNLYYENMDRVKAKKQYYFSKDYFLNFTKSNDYKTDVLMAVEKDTQNVVSAAMMVKTNNIIQYHISGTKNDYLNLSPIRLLIDEMRIKGTEENYTYFNLGGGLGNKEDELFRFKSSFSKDFKPFKVWKYIANEKIYNQLVNKKEINGDIDFFPLYRYE